MMSTVAAVILGVASIASSGPARGAAAAPVVTIHAKEYSYTSPASIKSGPTTFRLVNDGKELHHLTLVKLQKGKTMKDFAEAMKKQGPPPAWAMMVGGPNAVVPHEATEATITMEPGEYVMLCFVPSPGEQMPHAMKGMMHPLTVTAANNGATAPAADVNLKLTDYAFTPSKALTAGKHLIEVTNGAAQAHEVILVALGPGKKITDVGNWVEGGMKNGPPPGKPMGGISPMDKGASNIMSVDLKPGRYGMMCLAPDAKDGKTHFVHGMSTEFEVK